MAVKDKALEPDSPLEELTLSDVKAEVEKANQGINAVMEKVEALGVTLEAVNKAVHEQSRPRYRPK